MDLSGSPWISLDLAHRKSFRRTGSRVLSQSYDPDKLCGLDRSGDPWMVGTISAKCLNLTLVRVVYSPSPSTPNVSPSQSAASLRLGRVSASGSWWVPSCPSPLLASRANVLLQTRARVMLRLRSLGPHSDLQPSPMPGG